MRRPHPMLLLRGIIKSPASSSCLLHRSITTLPSTQSDHANPKLVGNQEPTPTSAHYDALINEAGRSGSFTRIHHLLTKRIHDGCFNTNNTFKFISSTPSSLSQLDSLFDILATLPKGFIRKSALDSLVARLCRLRLTDDALKVFDKMRQRGEQLNASSFHPLLIALTKQKLMEKACDVVWYMKDAGVVPDTTAYNYLLTGYCCIGDVSSAADVLTRMREDGLKGDKRTYDAMVLGACRAGKMNGAVAIMRGAEKDQVHLLYSTHGHVITALLKAGYYSQAMKFVRCYAGKDAGLDNENFELLASHLVKLERFADAKLLVDEMKARGLRIGAKLRDFHQLHRSS